MTVSATIDLEARAGQVRGGGSLVSRGLIWLVELYRSWVSPMLLPSCRFDPTCSTYAVQALRTRGALVGTVLTLVRVAKCAPWHPGGWDPVPPARGRTQDKAQDPAQYDAPDDAPDDEETAGPC